ncbi:MAG: prepilin peptidase [Sandaracinus sp.]|nr:prepilin peptidase [Sandaracinus sp.]
MSVSASRTSSSAASIDSPTTNPRRRKATRVGSYAKRGSRDRSGSASGQVAAGAGRWNGRPVHGWVAEPPPKARAEAAPRSRAARLCRRGRGSGVVQEQRGQRFDQRGVSVTSLASGRQTIASMAIGAGRAQLSSCRWLAWSYERLTGRRGMGEGDDKLLLFIGAFVGWQGVLFAIAAGSLQGIVVAAVALATRKPMAPDEFAADEGPGNLDGEEPPARCVDLGGEVSPTDVPPPEPKDAGEAAPEPALRLRLPFGPFLAVAALEWLFFGDRVLEWYLGFFDAG